MQKICKAPLSDTSLELGVHSRLHINLSRVAANYQAIQSEIAPTSELIPVVKTNAYGLGMDECSKALVSAGAKSLFVGNIREALELRKALPQVAIYSFLGPQVHTVELFLSGRIRPCINSIEQLKLWSSVCVSCPDRAQPAALHFDTGMGRQGLDPGEQIFLRDNVGLIESANVALYMSHLCSSDNSETASNGQQREAFLSVAEGLPKRPRSLANSDGIFLHNGSFRFEAARSALGVLAGVSSHARGSELLEPTVHLESPILELKNVPAGYTVSYGATYTCERASRLATIGIGFADGLQRCLANRGYFYIGEHRVCIRGKICMDTCVVDVTDVPESLVKIGRYIEIFGRQNSLQDFAQLSQTTPYLVLSTLAPRVQRCYHNGEAL